MNSFLECELISCVCQQNEFHHWIPHFSFVNATHFSSLLFLMKDIIKTESDLRNTREVSEEKSNRLD